MASCYVLLVSRRVNEPVIVRWPTMTPPPHLSGPLPSALLISHYPLDNVYTAVRNQQCPPTQAPSPKHNQNDDTLGRPCKPAMKSSALSWDVTQGRLVVIYRRFGTTHWSHLQGSSNSATSVHNYQSRLCKATEERRTHLDRGGSLTSHTQEGRELYCCTAYRPSAVVMTGK